MPLLVLSLGTPWGLLQSAAWFTMVVRYSRDHSVAQAVSMTFDGKHPCPLCHFVQKGQAAERDHQKQTPGPDLKWQLALPPDTLVLFHPALPAASLLSASPLAVHQESPPTPPPRVA